MTKLKTILMAIVAVMAMTYAGGDIAPVQTIEAAPVAKNFYVGVSTVAGESITSKGFKSFDNVGLGVQAGYTFFRACDFEVAVEGRYTSIVNSWSNLNNYGDVDTYGGFLKPQYNIGNAGVYGLIGYTWIDTPVVNSNGFAYGAGVSYAFNNTIEVFTDYVVNDDSEFNGLQNGKFNNELWTVGVNYRF